MLCITTLDPNEATIGVGGARVELCSIRPGRSEAMKPRWDSKRQQ